MRRRELPPGVWRWTDDTMMAISVVEVLRVFGAISEARLLEDFARRYDPARGYGPAMDGLLRRAGERGGAFWEEEARALFGGMGSMGNGSAMRVAPLGAYFADDLPRVVEEARRSAAATHAHPEASAGAIAGAVGTAVAWRSRGATAPGAGRFLEEVREWVPESEVRRGMEVVLRMGDGVEVAEAAAVLGNGSRGTAADTVAFAMWCAGRWMGDFEEAMWRTVSGLGDRDTTCAMVGGVVAMRVGMEGIPGEWRRRREAIRGEVGGGLK